LELYTINLKICLYGSDAYSESVQQQGLGEEYLNLRDNVTGR